MCRPEHDVYAVKFSPDGAYLAAGEDDGTVEVSQTQSLVSIRLTYDF